LLDLPQVSSPVVAKQVPTRHVISMVFPPSAKPASRGASGAEQAQRHRPAPLLNAAMTCETAFRAIAGRYLRDFTAHHEATCAGDAGALHEMRIALTRLRTTIVFFSPMVADAQRTRVAEELKWLNAHLGVVRDLDVAIEQLEKIEKGRSRDHLSWSQERATSQRHLTRALRSPRYQRSVKSIARWIEKGSWSTKGGKQAVERRACLICEYSARKLTRWQEKLIKKSRKLREIGAGKRHRLRLMNKRLSYAIESVADLVSDNEAAKLQATLKTLRKAQRSLGRLNDDARCRSLATTLGQGGSAAAPILLDPKSEKRLLRSAAAAYEKLADLKPLDILTSGP
jgi:CHAD domain-containing protein